MQKHNLIQGTPEWDLFRLEHFGASEAAAMLGLSKKVMRTELLRMKKTGTPREFSEWVQEHVLDHGHRVEAMARPIIEDMIGEDLYPVTCSDGIYSASLDGLTISGETVFEHKQWNQALADAVLAKELPLEHMPQCQQILMVTGAERVLFVVSDGTRENMVWMEVLPDRAWFQRLEAGWAQFARDLQVYEPAPIEVKPIGKTMESLPALRVELSGAVTTSNLNEYKEHALAVFAGINRELTTDQEFADAERAVRWCENVEERLAAAKQHALSQTESIDQLFRTIDEISAEARRVRLDLNNLVTKRKQEIKDGILTKARHAYEHHLAELKKETGGAWIALIPPDFAGAIKGKRSMANIQDAVDTTLANAKIVADAAAKRIRDALACIKEETAGFEYLFADKLSLIDKPLEDIRVLVKARITAHHEEERRKADERASAAQRAAEIQAQSAKDAQSGEVPAPVVAGVTTMEPGRAPVAVPFPQHAGRPAMLALAPPALSDIVQVLATHYRAPESMVMDWLRNLNLESAAPEITLQPVESSQIHAVGHDPVTETLAIQFKGRSGPTSVYHYTRFPAAKFREFMAAESLGSYFGKHIKQHPELYPYKKVA